MSLRFGTDGVRGVANTELTPELVLALGRAAARVLGPAEWIVGRDTRRSSPLLQAALSAGLASEGAAVVDIGVAPTPAVAFVAAGRDAHGAVVSASHNPFPDNGIKFFAAGGRKLTDDMERDLEEELRRVVAHERDDRRAVATDVGTVTVDAAAVDNYALHLASVMSGADLQGLTAVLDCANGAASAVAGEVFRRAGADAVVLHAQPDGANINHGCGSTHPELLQQAVVDRGAALGLAFDGDADRVIAVDENGALVDGDVILSLLAADLHERGQLTGGAVVVTVMTNLGFRRAMDERGIGVVETAVGDRYVLEAIEERGLSLGGEQSGHVIVRDLATTGDGMLTGLLLAGVVARADRPLSELAAHAMTRFPQVLKSVRVGDHTSAATHPAVRAAIASVEERLGSDGRVVLRPSGTEPVVRVMAEASSDEEAEQAVDDIIAAVLSSSPAT